MKRFSSLRERVRFRLAVPIVLVGIGMMLYGAFFRKASVYTDVLPESSTRATAPADSPVPPDSGDGQTGTGTGVLPERGSPEPVTRVAETEVIRGLATGQIQRTSAGDIRQTSAAEPDSLCPT